jgi:group I intron endonuclease
MVGIYKIVSPVGKIYIGQSIKIEQRFEYYVKLNCRQQIKLYNSLKKYTPENHLFEIVEECEEIYLNSRERYWQEYYDVLTPTKGLNLRYTEAEDRSGTLSAETRSRMSESKKGEKNHMYGRTHSEETKKKISEYRKGKKHTEETKKLLSEQRIGSTKTDKQKQAISDRQKISESNTFRHTEECPYCKKQGQSPNMKRWHFENCKNK